MKFLLPLLALVLASCASQKGYQQIEKARQACISVQEGEYEMAVRSKFMSRPDTFDFHYQTVFRKTQGDTLSPVVFWSKKHILSQSITQTMLYTGRELVRFPMMDSTAEYTSTQLWSKNVAQQCRDYEFFDPFVKTLGSPLPTPKQLEKPHTLTYLGKETVQGQKLRHWQVIFPVENPDTSQRIAVLKRTYDFWLNPQTSIPIKMTELYDMWYFRDTVGQFNEWTLLNHNLGAISSAELFTVDAVPTQYPLKNYAQAEITPLLAPGTEAPAFSLPKLDGGTLSLSDLKGKYVLLDFFYRSCYYCILAVPDLVAFNHKYKDRNVVVIGIDPVDQSTPELLKFLQQKGIDYPVLMEAIPTITSYQIMGYPATYFIGPDGKILESKHGFSSNSPAEWDNWVEKHVK